MKSQVFDSQQKALEAVLEQEDIYCQSHYCPILKDFCRPDCVAFKSLEIKKEGTHYKIGKFYGCRAPSLIGE